MTIYMNIMQVLDFGIQKIGHMKILRKFFTFMNPIGKYANFEYRFKFCIRVAADFNSTLTLTLIRYMMYLH